MAAIDETFYNVLEDDDEGYADLALIDLLDHLDDRYGEITPDDLYKNEIQMSAQWSPTQPLEDLLKQVRKAQAFARHHDPISDLKALRSLTTNLEKSGVFTEALREWRKRPTIEKTMANFHTHFDSANKERLRSITANDAGYGGAANQIKLPDKISITGTTKNNTLHYCWSHGAGPNANHTSKSCSRPCPGHNKEATIFNMMGGCNRIHRRKGERAIYKPPFNPNFPDGRLNNANNNNDHGEDSTISTQSTDRTTGTTSTDGTHNTGRD